MCGVHGIITCSLSEDEIYRRLENMGVLQAHRGPDDKKETVFPFKTGRLGFGFRRLSILDLETGMQPIISPEDKSAIICNGQVYNYPELKAESPEMIYRTKGDIEVALNMYRKYHLDFLQKLNGMYAGAIYDPVNSKIILFRDRFGIKPMYYTEWEDNFYFSSEIKPLYKGSSRPHELNRDRLETYFTYRYLPGTETMFSGIKRLPPGSYLEYDLNEKKYLIKRYWEYKLDRVIPDMDFDEASERFIELFRDAVKIRMRSDVEVGTLLSGGIDSSAVSSQATVTKPDIRLFSISFDEDEYNELPVIKNFIKDNNKRFGDTRHYARLCGPETLEGLPEIVRSIEEPISLGTILPTDQVCKMAGEKVKVVLTGEGADEIFAGYRKFLIEAAAGKYNDLSASARKELENIYPELKSYMKVRHENPVKRYIQSESLFTGDELRELTGKETINDAFPEDAIPDLSGNEHPLNAALAMESRARLPDYVILRLDKLSMRHSLETRTPFLDYRLAEFAATLPVEYKANLRYHLEKYICGSSFSRHSILDSDTAFRKKQPFTIPMADWLSDPSVLPECIKEIMFGDLLKKQGILNEKTLKKHIDRITKENVGPQTLVSEADRVFSIIIFSLWFDLFFS
jgi:asparagine synthase (glutamine-hydrolysing)